MTVKSETLLSAWGAFFVAHALSIQKIERALAVSAPLSLHEYDVLLMLDRSPQKRLRYSEVATQSIFTKSGITRIMKRLETRGFIDRERCESDGRGVFARLTAPGARALKDTWSAYSREILKIFDPALTHAEASALEVMLGKVIDQVSGPALVHIGSRARN